MHRYTLKFLKIITMNYALSSQDTMSLTKKNSLTTLMKLFQTTLVNYFSGKMEMNLMTWQLK